MKLFWCCIVATLITTISSATVDVERTVQQVQNILQANSLLPRLTREEIIQLLHDIKAEDAKSSSESKEISKKETVTTSKTYNDAENEINPVTQLPDIRENIITNEQDFAVSASAPKLDAVETTTKKSESTVMVVLPYTPRDGSSLQELYTRPPRIQVVPVGSVTPKPIDPAKSNEKLQEVLKTNAQTANKKKLNFPADLQAFLDVHGLKGNAALDHFLLPLEGFKPLPPAKVVDGSVQLPENILLTYDLISPVSEPQNKDKIQSLSQNDFLYKPLRPEFPFELDTSSSDTKETFLPLDLPKRNTKSNNNSRKPNYQPIDYDSVKVIPLEKGPNPVEDEKVILQNDLSKRQTNNSDNASANIEAITEAKTETSTVSNDAREVLTNPPPAVDSAVSNTDTGASITDLEDSFGGALPEKQSPPPKKNGFYWMLDWNSFLEVGDGDTKVNIRFEPKLGDPQMFLPVNVP